MRSSQFSMLLAFGIILALQAGTALAKKIDGDRLLAPDHLVEIRIELPQADWNKLRFQSRNPGAFFGGAVVEENPYDYSKADLWIDDIKIESVGVRKKGLFGSADNNRPSLKVKFDEFVKQDPVKGLSRLTLNNNKQDKSQLSQFLTYKLFRDAGVHAPRSNLARVTVNGRYLGIYSNVESIKKPFLARSFGDKTGNLYEGTLTDFHPKAIDKIEVKTNDETNDRSDIRRLAALLAAEGSLDLDELGRVIDVDDFMRYWAVEGLTRFWDGYASNQNNFYFYVNPKNGLGYFIPWGADWVLTKGGPFGGFSNQGNTAIYAQSILANRLYKTEGVPERYRKTMLKLLDDVWDEEELLSEVDRVEKLIASHLHASQRGAPRAMEDLRRFIKSRRQELQTALKDWPATVPNTPRKPYYTVTVGEVAGSFTTTFSQQAPRDGSSVGKASLKLKLDDMLVEFERIGVSASSFQFAGFGGPGFGGPGFGGPGFGGPGFGGGRGRPRPSGERGPGPQQNFQPPISLNFTGIRKSDGKRVTLSLTLDRKSFKSKLGESIDVTGRFTVGQQRGFGFAGFGGGGGRSVNGELRLTKAGTTAGAAVVGTIDLQVVETRGGFFNQRQPPRGRGPGAGLGQRPQGLPRPPSQTIRPSPRTPRSVPRAFDVNRD